MNTQEKQTLNLKKFGTTKPGLFQRVFGRLLPVPFITDRGVQPIWTASYHWKKANKEALVNNGYGQNVTVYSVITLISRIAAQAQWSMYKVKDVKSYNRFKAIQKQPYSEKQQHELYKAKSAALEPIDHYMNNVFLNPNEQQSGAEYMENLCGYKLLTGDSYEYANLTTGKKVAELWILPSQYIQIQTTEPGSFPMRELGYVMRNGGQQVTFTPEEINHSKYWTPYYDGNGSHLYGFSPLDAAWLSVLQDNNAREAAVELLKNRGARGVFAVESEAIKDFEGWERIRDNFKSAWAQNTKEYKDDIMPMLGRGQWHNVGLNAKDLAILEICKMNKDDICNAYGVNSILLNNNEASTDNNFLHAKKSLITNSVLPLLGSIRDSRNRKLKKDWAAGSDKVVCDFDNTIFTELDSDKKAIAEWMDKAGCFTDDEKRIQLGYEELGHPLSKEVWKGTNQIPMSMINENTFTRNAQRNEQTV